MRVALGLLTLIVAALAYRSWRTQHPTATTACASERSDAVKVLFVGNSHTFVNDLPGTMCGIAAPKHPMIVKSVVMGGWSLQQHWQDGAARKAIEGERWSFVVLQDRSDVLTYAPKELEDALRKFDPLISRAGARTIVYELWPRRDFTQDPQALEDAYVSAASVVHAQIAPAGPAWVHALAIHPELRFYQADGYHPRPEGTYLAACVFYGTLFGESPEGVPAGALDPALAMELQRIARQTIELRRVP